MALIALVVILALTILGIKSLSADGRFRVSLRRDGADIETEGSHGKGSDESKTPESKVENKGSEQK